MYRPRLRLTLVVLLTLFVTSVTFAQSEGRGGRRGRGFGSRGPLDKATLLSVDKVREELNVDADQAAKVDEILVAYREFVRTIFSSSRSRDASGEERAKLREEAAEKIAALRKETDKQLAATLKDEQTGRLNEILLQQQGVDGLASAYVVDSLKLEDDQVTKISELISVGNEEARKLGRGRRSRGEGGGGRDGGNLRETREKIRADTATAVLAVLSTEQRETLEKLKGAPFELDRRSLFQGRSRRNRTDRGDRSGGGRRGARRGGGRRARPPLDEEEAKA